MQALLHVFCGESGLSTVWIIDIIPRNCIHQAARALDTFLLKVDP